jgi:hypothetical protein
MLVGASLFAIGLVGGWHHPAQTHRVPSVTGTLVHVAFAPSGFRGRVTAILTVQYTIHGNTRTFKEPIQAPTDAMNSQMYRPGASRTVYIRWNGTTAVPTVLTPQSPMVLWVGLAAAGLCIFAAGFVVYRQSPPNNTLQRMGAE